MSLLKELNQIIRSRSYKHGQSHREILCSKLSRWLLSATVSSLSALLHLFNRHIFFVSRNMPDVSEGIRHRAEAIAIELVRHGFLNRRAGSNCLTKDRIDVFHIDHDADWRAAERLRTFVAHLGVFIRKHDRRIANLDLSVANLAVRRRKAKQFLCAKRFLIKFDRVAGAPDNQVRRGGVITVRNWFGHRVSLLLFLISDYAVVSLICPLMYHMLSNGSLTAPVRPP